MAWRGGLDGGFGRLGAAQLRCGRAGGFAKDDFAGFGEFAVCSFLAFQDVGPDSLNQYLAIETLFAAGRIPAAFPIAIAGPARYCFVGGAVLRTSFANGNDVVDLPLFVAFRAVQEITTTVFAAIVCQFSENRGLFAPLSCLDELRHDIWPNSRFLVG